MCKLVEEKKRTINDLNMKTEKSETHEIDSRTKVMKCGLHFKISRVRKKIEITFRWINVDCASIKAFLVSPVNISIDCFHTVRHDGECDAQHYRIAFLLALQ